MANHSKRTRTPAAPVRKTLASEWAELMADCPLKLTAGHTESLQRMFYSGAVSCFAILITDESGPGDCSTIEAVQHELVAFATSQGCKIPDEFKLKEDKD